MYLVLSLKPFFQKNRVLILRALSRNMFVNGVTRHLVSCNLMEEASEGERRVEDKFGKSFENVMEK